MPNSNVEPRAILIVPCAGGWMRRSVSCMETSSNTLVEEHHCNSVSKPASNNYCTQTPCTASYVLNIFTQLTLNGHVKTGEQGTIIQQCSNWYTGCTFGTVRRGLGSAAIMVRLMQIFHEISCNWLNWNVPNFTMVWMMTVSDAAKWVYSNLSYIFYKYDWVHGSHFAQECQVLSMRGSEIRGR